MRRMLASGWIMLLAPALLCGQGFGGNKKNVILERKLPAAVKMPGESFTVKVTAQNPQFKDVADRLQSVVETQMLRGNPELTENPDSPDTTVTIRVLNFNVNVVAEADPLAQSLTKTNRSTGQPAATSNHVTGDLSIAYQARAKSGATVDASPFEVKYSQVFDATSGAITKTKELFSKIPHPGRKPAQDDETPHTLADVAQILVNRTAERVAARLVNTNERVQVLLARGKLDEANRYAMAGQWTKFVEDLEMMAPLRSDEEDSYRFYNIGVGDEALGYKAESPASAKRYFEQAVLQYRKAGEANPKEKYFIEPVNRIQVALEHYRKLAAPAPAKAAPTKAAAPAPAKQGSSK